MAIASNLEQYMLELVNRARLDPLGEAARFGLTDLNQNLAAGNISSAPKDPLAANNQAINASRDHSNWMLANDIFDHSEVAGTPGFSGATPGARMVATGFGAAGSFGWGENIAWQGTTGSIDSVGFVASQHQALFLSAGHRTNTLDPGWVELGIGQVEGQFTSGGTIFNASMITQNYGTIGARQNFLTGVVYNDTVTADQFYTPGEGRSGVTVSVSSGGSVTTSGAGGFDLAGLSGLRTVTFSGGGIAAPMSVAVELGGGNVKVDLINGSTVHASGSATLGANAHNLVLLGDATTGGGNASANRIDGNSTANTLLGYEGNDRLFGYLGSDYLLGLTGNDTLVGGVGAANTMQGGVGDDTYAVEAVGDSIVEFSGEGIDSIQTTLASLNLAANVENLTFVGNLSHVGAGNDLGNTMIGGTGNDYLIGFGGDDVFIDGIGLNTLQGGQGNDKYAVQLHSDTVFELAGEGTADEVQTFLATYFMPSNVERLVFIGDVAHTGIGNAENNMFIGAGSTDTWTGNGGSDTYFRGVAGGGADIVTDFDANNASDGHDFIDLRGLGTSFGAVTITAAAGGTVVEFVGGGAMLLQGVASSAVDAGDFLFL